MADKPTIDDLQQQLQNAESPKNQEVKLEGSKAIVDDAVNRVQSGEVGAVWESMVIDALTGVRATYENEYFAYKQQFEQGFKKHKVTGLQKLDKLTKPPRKPKSEGVESGGRERAADAVIALLKQESEFFHDDENECWCRAKVPDTPDQNGDFTSHHYEVHNLNTEGFRDYAGLMFYRACGGSVGESVMKDVVDGLRPFAKYEGTKKAVCIRYAWDDGSLFVDMANDRWQVIEVTVRDWSIKEANEVPVLFTRDRYMQSLPEPEKGCDISRLWEALPIKDEEDRNRLLVWMVNAMLPESDYLLLELTGIAGSAKSGTHKVISSLIDPNKGDLLTVSEKVADIPVMAKSTHVVGYENVSYLTNATKDVFCTMLTGGSFGTRTLHKTSERSIWSIKRPIIINGVPHLAVGRDDLTQRTIRVEVPEISIWKSKKLIIDKWEGELRPKVLGALYDLLSLVLANLEVSTITESKVTRQVDYLREGQAVYDALGIDDSFENAILKMQKEQDRESIENCPVSLAIIAMMEDQKGYWKGTTTELLELLSDSHKGYRPSFIDKSLWPKGYHAMSSVLRRQKGLLAKVGIVFQRKKSGDKRPLEFRYSERKPESASRTTIEL